MSSHRFGDSRILKYKRKISGPIADRLDLWLEVSRIDHKQLGERQRTGQSSEDVRKKVIKAREIQRLRFNGKNIFTNAEMSAKDIDRFAPLSVESRNILNQAAKNLDLSPRSYHRVVKIARTIADLAGEKDIKKEYILEALQYRPARTEM